MAVEKVPFDAKGNQVFYAHSLKAGVQVNDFPEWRDNEPFAAHVRIISMERGRSAAHFTVENISNGARYYMFMIDLLDVIMRKGIQAGGLIHGTFQFTKRGQNYGVKLVD